MHFPGYALQSVLVLARQCFESIDSLGITRSYLQQSGYILPGLLLLQAEVMCEIYQRLAESGDVTTAPVIVAIITERYRA